MICLRYLCAALLLVCLVVVTCEASPQRFFRGGGGFHRGGGGFHRGGGGFHRGGGGFHRGGGGFHRGGGFAQPQFFRGGFRGRPHFFGGGFSAEVGGQNSFEFFG